MIQDDTDDDGSSRQQESDSSSDQDQDSGSDSEGSGEESDASEVDILGGLEEEVEANKQDDSSDDDDEGEGEGEGEHEDEDEDEDEDEYVTIDSRVEKLMDKLKHWPEDEDKLIIERDELTYFVMDIDPFCMSLRGNAVIKKIILAMDSSLLDSHFDLHFDLHGCFVKLGNVFGSLEALTELKLCGDGSRSLSVLTIAVEGIAQGTRQIRSFHFEAPFLRYHDRNFYARCIANALRHHPVQEIKMDHLTTNETCIIMNVLPTLPNLQKLMLKCNVFDRATALHPKALSQLLSISTLREVLLEGFRFTESGLQAISKGLSSGSIVSKLSFVSCDFPETGGAALAASLGQNAALEQLEIDYCDSCVPDSTFFGALKDSLPVNRTLTDFCMYSGRSSSLEMPDSCLVMALEGLGNNHSVRSFNLGDFPLTISVSDAWRECLEKNSVLQNLVIESPFKYNENYNECWRRILPSLRINSSLESLTIEVKLTKAILPETAEALQENSSLQRLTIDSGGFRRTDLIKFVGLLTKNTTLKHLQLGDPLSEGFKFKFKKKDSFAALLAAVRGNYGLESFNATVSDPDDQYLLECIQRLNKAGRRYLIEDPTSIEKGVMVLDEVKDDLDCLFLHLQENPMLCDCQQVLTQQPVSGRKRKLPESYEAAK